MGRYSIKDMEELSGIKAHTIRIWEKRYKLIEPGRTQTNIRYYCDEDLKKLLNISMLTRHGWKISRLAEMTEIELTEIATQLTKESSGTETRIEQMIVSMLDLDEMKFEKTLNNSILKIGFEETFVRVIYPFFDRIGFLWQIGTINVAQEHFISNLVRQKIITAIDGQLPLAIENAKIFMLFLHESELHELGLLFYNYMLQKHGHKVIYLGQAVPFNDLLLVAQICKTDNILTSFTTGLNEKDLENYLLKLAENFPDKNIFFTGYQTNKEFKALPRNLIHIKSADHFLKMLSKNII